MTLSSLAPTPAQFEFPFQSQEPVSSPEFLTLFEAKLKEVGERVRLASAISGDPSWPLTTERSASIQLVRRTQWEPAIESKLFDTLVSLKVAISRYAMHLSTTERQRLFGALDGLLNKEDWYDEDELPRPASFLNFLKWMLFAKNFDWETIGISDEGTILVGWLTERVQLTANFSEQERVTWTSQVNSETGVEYAAGTSSLQYFSRQSRFFLSENGTQV
jgi:hypothetical protein